MTERGNDAVRTQPHWKHRGSQGYGPVIVVVGPRLQRLPPARAPMGLKSPLGHVLDHPPEALDVDRHVRALVNSPTLVT